MKTPSCVCTDRRPEFFEELGSYMEGQHWVSLAAGLTRLSLRSGQEWMTEERCEVLCHLTRLQHLELQGGRTSVDPEQDTAVFYLDLPVLERLEISGFGLSSIRLNCPELGELVLYSVAVQSFTGMPTRVQKARLSLLEQSLPLEEILPGHSCELLESMFLCEDYKTTESSAIQALCHNGRLRGLTIISENYTVEALTQCLMAGSTSDPPTSVTVPALGQRNPSDL